MADRTGPETSTVRSALAVARAADAILRPGRVGSLVEEQTVVDSIEEAMRRGKELRPDQIDEVVAHLRELYYPTTEHVDAVAKDVEVDEPEQDPRLAEAHQIADRVHGA